MEVLKLKVQKLEVQETELLGGGWRGFSGALRCHSGVEKVRVILPSLKVRGRKAFHFTARIQ